jgi:hypothetical protein
VEREGVKVFSGRLVMVLLLIFGPIAEWGRFPSGKGLGVFSDLSVHKDMTVA